jgi:hypothetical protein
MSKFKEITREGKNTPKNDVSPFYTKSSTNLLLKGPIALVI